MVAEPGATAVTRPSPDTVATVASLLVHSTVRPDSTFPAESFVVAHKCSVAPISTVAGVGCTVTDATGAGVEPGGGGPIVLSTLEPSCPQAATSTTVIALHIPCHRIRTSCPKAGSTPGRRRPPGGSPRSSDPPRQ